MHVCMFYLGPFSIKGVQYTHCDVILNMWTKLGAYLEVLRLLLTRVSAQVDLFHGMLFIMRYMIVLAI